MSEVQPEPCRQYGDAVARFLPHTGPARLVQRVIEWSDETLLCVARFPADNALVVDGEVATHLVVEPAAQAAAAHQAILAVERGAVLSGFEGYLTTAKAVTVSRPTIPADTDLQVRVRPHGRLRKPTGGLFKCAFEARIDGTVVARGELSSFVQTVTG